MTYLWQRTFSPIKLFFTREPIYFVLALLTIMAIAVARMAGPAETSVEAPQEMAQLESRILNEYGSESEFLQAKMAENPQAAKVAGGLAVSFIILIGLGIGLDCTLWLNRANHRQWIEPLSNSNKVLWDPLDSLRFIILFFFGVVGMEWLFAAWHYGAGFESSHSLDMMISATFTDIWAVAVILYLLKLRGAQKSDIGLRLDACIKDAGIGLMAYLALFPVFLIGLMIVMIWTAFFQLHPQPHPLVEVFMTQANGSPAVLMYSLFLACILGPILEEIFFRGFFLSYLKKHMGLKWAILVSSACFAALHGSWFAFLPIMFLGAYLAWLAETRKSLMPGIVMHCFHNLLFIGYFFVIKGLFLN